MYSEMRLNDVDTLAHVTIHEQQSGCVEVFAEGGGTVYVQASTTSLLPRKTMLSLVVTNFLHDFILFLHSSLTAHT